MTRTLPKQLQGLRIPVLASPLFIISNPKLVIAQCKAGIIGSFPCLNARPAEQIEAWMKEITEELDRHNQANPDNPAAPWAVNQIVHRSNDRLMHDIEMAMKYKAPITITSLGARADLNDAMHSVGGITLHDVINDKFAKKAVEKGADGLIAVAWGAGGHAGTLSPFALVNTIRAWYDGPLLLSGTISTGGSVLAAQAMGADLAYIGSPFIATHEAAASEEYKQAIVENDGEDIVYTNLFTGVHGNYLRPSIEAAGMDPDNLPESDPTKMQFGSGSSSKSKAWKDIWGCGQGIGPIDKIQGAGEYVDQLAREYTEAKARLL